MENNTPGTKILKSLRSSIQIPLQEHDFNIIGFLYGDSFLCWMFLVDHIQDMNDLLVLYFDETNCLGLIFKKYLALPSFLLIFII